MCRDKSWSMTVCDVVFSGRLGNGDGPELLTTPAVVLAEGSSSLTAPSKRVRACAAASESEWAPASLWQRSRFCQVCVSFAMFQGIDSLFCDMMDFFHIVKAVYNSIAFKRYF